MPGKPYQSCLNPYEDEIVTLRRKRPPTPYSKIADLLREKYQISVRREAVYSFIKIRAKQNSKTCKYAWSINADNQPATEAPSVQKQTVLQTPASKPKIASQSKDFEMNFSDTYNLHRLTDEQAEAFSKQLRTENLKKENQ